MWLALQDRLKTKKRLMQICVYADARCYLCMHQDKDLSHLFFGCIFSSRCIQAIMSWIDIKWQGRSLMQFCRWLNSRYKGSGFIRKVGIVVVIATVYMIWKDENLAFWEGKVHTMDHTIDEIKYTVKHRIIQIISAKITDRDKCWIERL